MPTMLIMILANLVGTCSGVVPVVSVTNVVFSDLDVDKDQLGGTVTWSPPADVTTVTEYNVYLATNPQGAGKTLISANIAVGINTASMPADTPLGNNMYLVVLTANADGDQTNAPGSLVVEDQVAVISSLSFEDKDLDNLQIGGTMKWSFRGTAPVIKYHVFLAEDGSGLNKIELTVVTQGATYAIPADTAYGTHGFICVYAASSLAMASSPSAIQFYDVDSPVRGLAFTDLDLDANEVGGSITWVAPLDKVDVTGYLVYRSTSASAANKVQLGSYGVGTESHSVPVGTASNNDFYHVYSKSSLAVRSAPVSITVVDNFAQASNVVFQDLDLDSTELGGTVSFNAATVMTYVKSYQVYFAETQTGGSRSNRIGAASLDLTRAINSGTKIGAYKYIVVYASSTLAEQTKPAFLAIADVAALSRSLSFEDQDAANGKLGGLLTWSAPVDVSQVVSYNAYWATNAASGWSRTQLGANIPKGNTLSVTVPAGAVKGSYTHFAVYAVSAQGEQSTPALLSIVDLYYNEGAWGACSTACDPGTQTRSFTCSGGGTACDGFANKPASSRACNLGACTWNTGAWGACSKACGAGTETRSLTCSGGGTACDGLASKPASSRACNLGACTWNMGAWGACSAACGPGTETRSLTCSDGGTACWPLTRLGAAPSNLDVCQGDCDIDADCPGASVCVQRTNGQPAAVDGCSTGDSGSSARADTDYCSNPAASLQPLTRLGAAPSILDVCQGDCDNDAQCPGASVCAQRTNGQPATVDGCSTGDSGSIAFADTDYCSNPAASWYNKPASSRACTGGACAWNVGAWGACDCEEGQRTRVVTCSNGAQGCVSIKPEVQQSCSSRRLSHTDSSCGCHDNGDHDPMRPWGRKADVDCSAQWWVIFSIITFSCLLCCCIAGCAYMLALKKKVPPPVVVKEEEGNTSI